MSNLQPQSQAAREEAEARRIAESNKQMAEQADAEAEKTHIKTHVGVEAAVALLLVAALTLSAVGCVVRAFCGYSLCCLGRDRKDKVRTPTPRGTAFASVA